MASQKELYSYNAPWSVYGLHWSQRPGTFRLGLGSFIEDQGNKVQIIELYDRDADFILVDEVDHQYPCTKLLWQPYKATNAPDLFATTGDFLRIWEVKTSSDGPSDDRGSSTMANMGGGERPNIVPRATLRNQRRTDLSGRDSCAPITSMDWNETDPNIVITSSIDTTCTVWDLSTLQAKTQLIAHDKEVYDVAFSRGNDVFASVGADGSLRMFDLRNLEHSTILYEVGPVPREAEVPTMVDQASDGLPLLRLSWNKQDPNYIATFQTGSSAVLIMDIRVPAIPVTELRGHGSAVTAIGDDAQALVWDISQNNKEKQIQDPLLAYSAEGPINQLMWSASSPDWIAISLGSTVQALRV
ncbi:hypothetical protein SpCBS45565_g06451 [Spizellomyces sp. 'palustris']|nr:hypothetical protein SpCBS45565_g06451 [Spizellomyces sp. 'palustris']